MVELDLETAQAAAGRWGLPLAFAVKEFYVFDLLSQVVSLDETLVLKGGTALNKIYLGKLQRFSEDADFDASAQSNPGRWVQSLSQKLIGFRADRPRRLHQTFRVDCFYETPYGQKDNVRLEVAFKKHVKTIGSVQHKTASSIFSGLSVARVPVYALDDLVSRKMNALRERCEGKDVYDVFHALPLTRRLPKAIAALLESEEETLSVDDFLKQTVDTLNSVKPWLLRNLTNPYIPVNSRPADWKILVDSLADSVERLRQASR